MMRCKLKQSTCNPDDHVGPTANYPLWIVLMCNQVHSSGILSNDLWWLSVNYCLILLINKFVRLQYWLCNLLRILTNCNVPIAVSSCDLPIFFFIDDSQLECQNARVWFQCQEKGETNRQSARPTNNALFCQTHRKI